MNASNIPHRKIGIGSAVQAACVMEVIAPKPGNVYPGSSGDSLSMTVEDFLRSARAIRSVFDAASRYSMGELVKAAVQATRSVVSINTNLGQVLLLAPAVLSKIRYGAIDPKTIRAVVEATTIEDSVAVYEAIRLASPGGMGRKEEQDISEVPTLPLSALMAMAASYDDVAAQYADDFADVFTMRDELVRFDRMKMQWKDAIVATFIRRLTKGDTLVRRKCGTGVESELKRRAVDVMAVLDDRQKYSTEVKRFDGWLREAGNSRNPGTTADLITAALFVGLMEGGLPIPGEIATELL